MPACVWYQSFIKPSSFASSTSFGSTRGTKPAAAIALEVVRQPTTDRLVVQASAISATFVRGANSAGRAVENGLRFGRLGTGL